MLFLLFLQSVHFEGMRSCKKGLEITGKCKKILYTVYWGLFPESQLHARRFTHKYFISPSPPCTHIFRHNKIEKQAPGTTQKGLIFLR